MTVRSLQIITSALFVVFYTSVPGMAQGVTTGSLAGKVLGSAEGTKQPLIGATVKAIHTPTGATYGAIVRSGGSYTIRGMRIGGPYTVTVSFVGYQSARKEGITIVVGETTTENFVLAELGRTANEIVVTASGDDIFDKSKTGSGSVISNQMIAAAPTINRSLSDMARLNPYTNQSQTAGSDGLQGITIAGVNSRFNNFQIDGAVANDLFSLSSAGTAGGQSNANLISLDAIEELRVNVSPYDIRQSGFTGGLVNAITRGGTNQFRGSFFVFGRNESFVGLSPDANRLPFDAFSDFQFGGRVGGPIVENTLLFHVTAEIRQRQTPIEVGLNDPNALNNFPVDAQVISQIRQIALERWNYDAGSFDRFISRNNTLNLTARLDWNISEKHKLQLRHNYTNAFLDRNVNRDARRFSMGSQANEFTSINNQTVMQLNSLLSEQSANELRVSFTQTNDERVLGTRPFPQVQIQMAGGVNVLLGPERNSQANALDQTQLAITDDFTMFLGDHTITLGTHNELSWFNNLFIPDFYGSYQFPSVEDFRLGQANLYQVSYANEAVVGSNAMPRPEFSIMQFGLYAMDEWNVTEQLRLTGGLRIDVPVFPDQPYENPAFAAAFPGRNTSSVPSSALLWSPRIGFNFDALGDKSLQIRGGTGLFTGRVAYVWISNQYANTGMDLFRSQIGTANGIGIINGRDGLPFQFDLNASRPPRPGDSLFPGSAANTSAINITDPSFRLPQVWRSTLGADFKIAKGLTLTVEGMYGAFLNTVDYQDLNIRQSRRQFIRTSTENGTTIRDTIVGVSPLDGRPLYATAPGAARQDSLVSPLFTQALLLRSRNEGYQYSTSIQLNLDAKNDFIPGLFGMISYTYGRTFDLNAGTAATASSQFSSTDAIDPNNNVLGRSNFDIPHRVLVGISYRKEWAPKVATTIGVFYSGNSGRPYSLSYAGDYNGDNVIGDNDLIYVPRREDFNTRIVVPAPGGTDLRTPEQIWNQVMSLVESNPILREYQGRILPRNALREPWINQLDMRISQDLPSPVDGHSFAISLDVQNVLNLLSADWGLQRYVNFQSFNIFQAVNQGGSVFDDQGRLRMTYTEPVTNGRPGIYFTDNFFSRWRMQLGVRYTF